MSEGKRTHGVGEVSALGFYSALERAVMRLPVKEAGAQAWREQLQGLVNRGAVKAQELRWSGLVEWLDGQAGRVGREQLLLQLRTCIPAADHKYTRSPEFAEWFGRSKVVDDIGNPLVVFRGEHRAGDGQPLTTLGSFTFTDDVAVAERYALHPNDSSVSAEAPHVIPAFLVIERPLLQSTNDPFVEFADLVDKLGDQVAERFARKHAPYIVSTDAWADDFGDEYASVDELLDNEPEQLHRLCMLAYPLLDDPDFVQSALAAGYDGAIHAGSGQSRNAVEYRAFRVEQIKSAIGNRGTFSQEDSDIAHSRMSGVAALAALGDWSGPLSAYRDVTADPERDQNRMQSDRPQT